MLDIIAVIFFCSLVIIGALLHTEEREPVYFSRCVQDTDCLTVGDYVGSLGPLGE